MLDVSKINIENFSYFEEVSSTSDVVLEQAKLEKISEFEVCFAEKQTKSRGRFNKPWETFPYKSLAFSFLLKEFAEALPLVLCVSLHKVLNNKYNANVKIKWPNDILAKEKKLSGILIESYMLANTRVYVVGIGVNVFRTETSEFSIAGFLQDYTNIDLSREELLNDIFKQIKEDIEHFRKNGFEMFRTYFLDNCQNLGKKISIKRGNIVKNGVFKGINAKGHLILNEKGIIVEFPAGEILQKKL
ncbi:MAG: biotin--[acetyl-CoA-carboxylase] ligase [Proteobacteria bacterium]|nr:biotin--[acetyl-CoA-carboxylase] ligase [Pseudomonadota bacterium]